MDQTHFLDSRSAQEIKTLFSASRLLPFFGSGFTKGASAKKGRVPDAVGLTKNITDIAAAKVGLSEIEVGQIKEITSLKDAFGLLGAEEYITSKSAQTFLMNIFSEVDLPNDARKKILSIDWPHIFTFNVDDAIERQNRVLKVLQPNKKTSREYMAANRCLFKIHGDITEFASQENIKLIFTWREYAHSIQDNKAMLGFLSEEAQNSAFLFIGCSLDAELDLIHLTRETPLAKSIYLKKGPVTVKEKLTLASYGIDRVIYFDDYGQIYDWIFEVLKEAKRTPTTREISFDDSPLIRREAISLLSNGGPVYKLDGQTRVARASSTFAQRTAIESARAKIRSNECLLVSGRRFSGKTLFLFQLMLALQEYSIKFFGSTDSYSPKIRHQIENLNNHLFVFDANHLDSESLDEVLRARMLSTSKIIICASFGDVERVRFKLIDKGLNFSEICISNFLDVSECSAFNGRLEVSGLPIINRGESLINYAFRCYEEYRGSIPDSKLFEQKFKRETYLVLTLLAAFGKAKKGHIDCIYDCFDLDGFVRQNERIFEVEVSANGERVLVCSASAWLLKIMHGFVADTPDAHAIVSNLIRSLERGGYSSLARELIRIDKINEISGGNRSRLFIKKIYEDISDIYSAESHYWLQRAKADLISAQTIKEVLEGVGHGQKVRLDNAREKNQTYFSATLVLAQLYAKAYKISRNDEYLLKFISPCIESIEDYQNNKKHIDAFAKVDDVVSVVGVLRERPPTIVLPDFDKVKRIVEFFKGKSSRKSRKK